LVETGNLLFLSSRYVGNRDSIVGYTVTKRENGSTLVGFNLRMDSSRYLKRKEMERQEFQKTHG
jgi:hypothetical protein